IGDKLISNFLPSFIGAGPLFFVHELINKQIEFLTELLGQIIPQKRNVVVQLTNFEHLFSALATLSPKSIAIFLRRIVPALLYILKNLVAQLVRIQLSLVRRHHARMKLGKLQMLARRQFHFAHDSRVPDASPALVHDLRLHLRNEILHLIVDHAHHVPLPVLKRRRVLHYVVDQVLLRRTQTRLRSRVLGSILISRRFLLDEQVVIATFPPPFLLRLFLICSPFRISAALHEEIWVDVLVDWQHRVKKFFFDLSSVSELVFSHSSRVHGCSVHHPPVGLREINVVLEEIDVAKDVRNDQLVLSRRVRLQQKRVRRVGVDNDFVDLGEAEVVHHLHPMIRLAKGPVGIAARQCVRSDFVHHRCRNDLEIDRERIESKLDRCNLPGLFDRLLEFLYFLVSHRTLCLLPALAEKFLQRGVNVFFVVDPHTYKSFLRFQPILEDRQQSA